MNRLPPVDDRLAPRRGGFTTIVALALGTALAVMATVCVKLALAANSARRTQETALRAQLVLDSALAQAMNRVALLGEEEPVSGGGLLPAWVSFGDGEFLYRTDSVLLSGEAVISVWARLPRQSTVSGSPVAPDDASWDGGGYFVRGLEVTVLAEESAPPAPFMTGNGGIQNAMGGLEVESGTDLTDPTTWTTVTSSGAVDSQQDASLPFEISALDHPVDYLYGGAGPAAAQTPHPWPIMVSRSLFAQRNTEGFFLNSGGSGVDPRTKLSPSPTSTHYSSDPASASYAYPIQRSAPRVHEFATDIWRRYKYDSSATRLSEGSRSGTYGDLSNPGVTIVTGKLHVSSGDTFKGAGILLIRDDFDPDVDTDNEPSARARLDIDGTFQWTGVVIVAGWNAAIKTRSGSSTTIVGGLMAEDTVQSMSEVSLESSGVIFDIDGPLKLLFSEQLVTTGGLVHPILPRVRRKIAGIRSL